MSAAAFKDHNVINNRSNITTAQRVCVELNTAWKTGRSQYSEYLNTGKTPVKRASEMESETSRKLLVHIIWLWCY